MFAYDFAAEDIDNVTSGQMLASMASFAIDINGTSKPNKIGRDIFFFDVGNNGLVAPNGSMPYAEMMSFYTGNNINNHYWKTSDDAEYSCKDDGQSLGYGCAARVLETGRMDYNERHKSSY